MDTTVFYGRTASLIGQFETAFRTEPVTPAAQSIPFEKLGWKRIAERVGNDQIELSALSNKTEEVDSRLELTLEQGHCLNALGWLLKALMGAPVTSGAGPYTHVFTFDLRQRPSALMELRYGDIAAGGGAGANPKWHRGLGLMLNELSWDFVDPKQLLKSAWLGSVEVMPQPTDDFDDAPAAKWARLRACKKRSQVYDVTPNSTLGKITKAGLVISNDYEMHELADAQEGIGAFTLGQPKIELTLTGLLTNLSIFDHGYSHTTKPVTLITKDASGTYSGTLVLPNVEFSQPERPVETSKGLFVEGLKAMAHFVSGAASPTFTLVNSTPSYA